MFELKWGDSETSQYHHGIDRGVIRPHNLPRAQPIPWNGLVSVTPTADSNESDSTYLDGLKVYNSRRGSDFAATIDAYYTPPEFDPCEGIITEDYISSTNNPPIKFDLSYRTMIGPNDYQLHIVYNCLAKPTSNAATTIGDVTTPDLLSWEITTNPNAESGREKTHFILDTTKIPYTVVATVEKWLYGGGGSSPRFISYPELRVLATSAPTMTLTLNQETGVWTASSSTNEIVSIVSAAQGIYQINWDGIELLGDRAFNLRT